MSFGKKSSQPQQTTPQPTFTQSAPKEAPAITRQATSSAEAQDRAATNNSAASLLSTENDEEAKRRQAAGFSTY